MTDTTITSANSVINFSREVMTEYFNRSGFAMYTGENDNYVIQVKNEFQGKQGNKVSFPIIGQLKGDGVTGSEQLWGNEEDLTNTAVLVELGYLRNGVRVTSAEGFKSQFDVLKAARPLIVNWAAGKLRNSILTAMGSVLAPTAYAGTTDTVDINIPYNLATAAQISTHITNNSDRIYAGGLGITSQADIASKATKISTPEDLIAINTAVRSTLIDNFPIKPVETDDDAGYKWYVHFVDTYTFSQIKTALLSVNQMGEVRGKENPLYRAGDIVFDGVTYRQIPELQESALSLSNGTTDVNVHRSYVCGAQSVLLSYGRADTIRTQDFDYGFQSGVAIETCRGIQKASVNGKGLLMEVYTV